MRNAAVKGWRRRLPGPGETRACSRTARDEQPQPDPALFTGPNAGPERLIVFARLAERYRFGVQGR
jgi:hypothetical protein